MLPTIDMKRIIICMYALVGSIGIMAQLPQQLQVKELTLSNGMTVWLNEDHSLPKVFGAVVVRAGGKDSPNTGIAHYFEHIMFKGTDRLGTIDYEKEKPWLDSISAQYDLLAQTTEADRRKAIQKHINELSLRAADYAIPNEFNRLISRYGGSGLNAATSYDMTFYHNSFLPQFIKQWCILNSERLMHPVFRGFQGELENVYEEKNRSSDNMGDVLETIMQTLFKDRPYAYPILGSTESLKNPRLSEMESFFKKYYVASNMGLILCGDITCNDSLTTILENTFGRVQTGPVPDRQTSPMPPIAAGTYQEVKLPIPIIGVEALVYQAPTEFAPDYDALRLANKILSNGKAGLIDSLVNEHALTMALAQSLSLNDAAGTALLIIPKLPFGKMKKAEAQCMAQLQKVIDGNFPESQVESLKKEMMMEEEVGMESLQSRAQRMIELFSKGKTWQEHLDKMQRIALLTKQDIMAAAKKYYGANYVTFKKKFGIPSKEKLSQPGYKPIKPKNADAQSALAKELAQIPMTDRQVRLVDFNNDVTTRQLSPHATLYYKQNPVNDIFSFTLSYQDGTLHSPKLGLLAEYLLQLGTDSLKKQQLEKAWQQMGVTFGIEADRQSFSFNLQGRDAQLKPALSMLAHFLRSAKGAKIALDEIKSMAKVEHKGFGKQKDDVLMPTLEYVMFGNRSSYLTQLSKKEVAKMTDEELMQAFRELQEYDCDLFYCGKLPIEDVANKMAQSLPVSTCQKPKVDIHRTIMQYDKPTVFVYDVPKSRQNYILSYDAISPLPTEEQRATLRLWGQYFGGGMSSVLFQNVREYQSLAYSTQGESYTPSIAKYPQDPLAYVTITGTQADKTQQACSTIDSLLRNLPMREENLSAARQELLNNIQNGYPDFRHVATYVANNRDKGFLTDPNESIVKVVPTISTQAIEQFHDKNIANNNRVWVVIGDKKKMDFNQLSTFGNVVEWKKADIYR